MPDLISSQFQQFWNRISRPKCMRTGRWLYGDRAFLWRLNLKSYYGVIALLLSNTSAEQSKPFLLLQILPHPPPPTPATVA